MQVTTRMTLPPSGVNAPPKARKAPHGCTAHGLPNFDQLGGLIVSEDSQRSLLLQANYRLQARFERDPERCKENSSGRPLAVSAIIAAHGGQGATGGARLNRFRMAGLADGQKDRFVYRAFPAECGALYRDLPDWTGGAAE